MQDVIAWIIIYLAAFYVLPVLFLNSGSDIKYWQVVAGFHFLAFLVIGAMAIVLGAFWAVAVILS